MEGITFESKSKYLLTKDERNELEPLRLKGGLFWKELNNKFSIGIITLVRDSNKIIGWSLVFPRHLETVLFLYVSKKYRRIGIGTKLYSIAIKNFGPDLYTSSHDSRAGYFFSSIKK